MDIKALLFGISVHDMVLNTQEEAVKRLSGKDLEIDTEKRVWKCWGIECPFGETNRFSYNGQTVICVFDLDYPGDAEKLVEVAIRYYRDRD